jgi:hypothetical protein
MASAASPKPVVISGVYLVEVNSDGEDLCHEQKQSSFLLSSNGPGPISFVHGWIVY